MGWRRTAIIAATILVYADVMFERILYDYDSITTSCALRNALSPLRVTWTHKTAHDAS